MGPFKREVTTILLGWWCPCRMSPGNLCRMTWQIFSRALLLLTNHSLPWSSTEHRTPLKVKASHMCCPWRRAKCKKYEQQETMEATLRCLEAPMQPAAAQALNDGRAFVQPMPAQGSAAARPNSAQVGSHCPVSPRRAR